MSEKERQKKDHRRQDKDQQAMREASNPRKEQASVRYGEQERSANDGRRRGQRIDSQDAETE